jgi:two-component system chemotaxis response regulator CheB
VIVVAGSTGAVSALEQLATDVADLHPTMLVVQHLPPGREHGLARALSRPGMPARAAEEGDVLEPGLFLAPSGRHMSLGPSGRVRLVEDKSAVGHCPSADVLFRSAAVLKNRAIAVVLSGLGNDGADGMAAVAASGGKCFAMAPADCVAPSMPRAALEASRKVRAVRLVDLGATMRSALEC